jgi:predicted PhzF superfamily epimerase YddE/YHI9
MGAGLAPERYTASQGTKLGRAGRIFLERDAQAQVWVGGESVTGVEGKVWL